MAKKYQKPKNQMRPWKRKAGGPKFTFSGESMFGRYGLGFLSDEDRLRIQEKREAKKLKAPVQDGAESRIKSMLNNHFQKISRVKQRT